MIALGKSFEEDKIYCDFNYLIKGKNNLDTKWVSNPISSKNREYEKYLFTQISGSIKNKFGRIETGWVSKNYTNSIIFNQIPFNQNGMLYIELILELYKKYKIN